MQFLYVGKQGQGVYTISMFLFQGSRLDVYFGHDGEECDLQPAKQMDKRKNGSQFKSHSSV